MTPAWHSRQRRVGWTEVDPSSNYQFSTALRYAEEVEISLLRSLGVLQELYPHFPRTFVHADFRHPARFDDVVTVRVRVHRVGRSAVQFAFRIELGERLCAEGILGAANVDASGRSTPLPPRVREVLQAAMTPEDLHATA